jgi:hypothetical protein
MLMVICYQLDPPDWLNDRLTLVGHLGLGLHKKKSMRYF